MKNLKNIFTPETRSYLYRVSIAVIALLAVTGVVTQELLPAVIGLAGAVFAISVADANVPTKEEDKLVKNDRVTNDIFLEGEDDESVNPFTD